MPARSVRKANAFLDERLGTQSFLERGMNHIFPDNWSFMLGEMAAYCLFILIVTGVYLAFFFDPSDGDVIYHGPYIPLRGLHMSSAYKSVVDISLQVRMGLLFRQIHHWAANIFIATLLVHMVRVFVTGAFRKPRDINWMIGLTLFLLSVFNGFSGYSLPGDLLSGIGLRIAYSIAESVPVIGPWMVYLFFGGQFPSDQLTHRLYLLHVFVVPLLILGLLGAHLALVWHQKHTQFPGKGRTNKRVVGSQLWPTYTARSVALFCGVSGVIVILSGVAQINPIWLYGPYRAGTVSSFAQPDWYVGWLEGALRLFPAWRVHVFGYRVSVDFWPAVVFPLITFVVLYAWPALERFMTGDVYIHNVLDRPRDRPVRTAVCVGALALYLVVYVAGAQDVLAFYLQAPQPPVTIGLRVLGIALPIILGLMTWRICHGLASAGRLPETEPPVGSHKSAKPPIDMYLPERVKYEPAPAVELAEEHAATLVREKPQSSTLRRLAGLAAGIGAGFAVGRRRSSSTGSNGRKSG